MASVKLGLNGKQALKLALANAGALLFLAPTVQAAELTKSASGASDRPIQIAASNDCINDIAEGFSVETTNHYVGICYTRKGTFYVGRAKNGKGSILLPVSSPKRNVYVAKNGRYTYTLNLNTNQLIITLPNGRRSIERVVKIIDS
ncbi:hypothetical protein [Coleofasciculus sp. FACHB-129]|uniref:hypothetical protein n=1 Tax=Cyanophyceae TaxID=3028117 RepID=UPI0016886AA2|nr:hypothetical protein [Coleofasciculus sp. FACHB-129]MBD1896707.1 hypothetical protein [Coleofasciculus sp. FACHB-129]